MTLETILLAIGPKDSDRIDELAEAVLEIATPSNAEVVIAHVFTPEEFENTVDRLDFENISEADPDDVAQRHGAVRTLTNAFDEADVKYGIRGRVGDHATEIVDLSTEVDADRIVVGGRKRSPSGKAVFGSVAQDIMLEAHCPVTFVKGE
ncbi:universal stress protein [Halorhabdus amylolytica]|uniref:universal stress protein n=1 Tax=Halorhabdus amylolytica TaxID=2559573 RepID=UPI0010AB120D|nr:universal stress protein [Halorhabdus amylolytica]